MEPHFDTLENRDPQEREAALFAALGEHLPRLAEKNEGLRRWLSGVALDAVTDRQRLAELPVLRKPELLEMQRKNPPFGGFVDVAALNGRRVFMSPGPIWEVEGGGADPWQAARALYAAGARPGGRVHNAFAYQMTPGGFILDGGALALGCTVLPAGTGNTETQVEAALAFKPEIFCGTPDFLQIMLDKASALGRPLTSFKRGLVSGGALFPSLRDGYRAQGIDVFQCYATAEFGVIAYETADENGQILPGMVVNENLIVEIVRPGTNDPVPEGEVGEVVVTSLNPTYPLVRLGTGDLSKVLPGPSACGRTNIRLAGWMGRADQRTKVKGMFVDPKQIAELAARHPEIGFARLTVSRTGARDVMTLSVEPADGSSVEPESVTVSLREITKVGGKVEVVEPGSLPRDGKVIADERDYSD